MNYKNSKMNNEREANIKHFTSLGLIFTRGRRGKLLETLKVF